MYFVFLLISLFGFLYFLVAKRRFDYFSLAYFSALIYFMPGFFGFTYYHVGGVWISDYIVDETYLIMTSVLAGILFFGFLFSRDKPSDVCVYISSYYLYVTYFILFFALIGLSGMLLSLGGEVFNPNKGELLEKLGRWHILFSISITMGLPLAFSIKNKVLFFLFFALLLFDLYVGFRSPLAIAFLSVFVLFLSQRREPIRLIGYWKFGGAVFLFGLSLFIIKHLLYAIKIGDYDRVLSSISDSGFWLSSFIKSEPFIIQAILNEVVINQFKTGFDHINHVVFQFILFSNNLGVDVPSFNGYFQPALFPDVGYGMANNIWAQMWSAGGWGGVIVFLIFFLFVVSLFNKILYGRSVLIQSALAPMACYWCFYIHRNDLGYAVNLEKRILILFFLSLFMVIVLKSLALNIKKNS